MRAPISILLLLLTGCSTTRWGDFYSKRTGTNSQFDELTVKREGTNTTFIHIKGYTSDQVKVLQELGKITADLRATAEKLHP